MTFFILTQMAARFTNSKSKVKTLIDSITADIISGELLVGDDLLSINEMSKLNDVSRDTVFKAYRELKERGIVDSTPTKSYYVKGDVNNVLLLLDTYSPFKEELYNDLIKNLPKNKYKVDLMFHQYSERFFDTIIRDSIGRYNYYIVMNFSYDKFAPQIESIPSNRLLLLDFGNFGRTDLSYVCQDFGGNFYGALLKAKDNFKKYTKLVMLFPENNRHPSVSIDHFERFCIDHGFRFEVLRNEIDRDEVRCGDAYICILQKDMVSVIRACDSLGFELGRDVGLLAYNDMPIHEVIKNGVSSVSVDFGLMGSMAAKFIESGEVVQEFLPTELILRRSL